MSFYGAFSTSVRAMTAQSEALTNIGINIANIGTGGYKRVDTHFQSMLSSQTFEQSDMGGPRETLYNRFDRQGNVVTSNSNLDVAISGKAFFTLVDPATGEELYGRDGAFKMSLNANDEGYLVDKNGLEVQGWPADQSGVVSTTGTPTSMRIDANAFVDDPQQSTEAALRLNLPSTANADDSYTYAAGLFDTAGNQQSVDFTWTKQKANEWKLSESFKGDPVVQIDDVTIAGTVDQGDVYSVKVGATTVSYTVLGTEADINAVRDGLVTAINADATVGAVVTAAAGTGAGVLTLTGDTAGNSYTVTPSTTHGPDVAQVDTVTIAGTLEDGDTYDFSVVYEGTPYTYTHTVNTATDTSLAVLRNNIITQLNLAGNLGPAINATPGGADGEIVLTAEVAGNAITTTVTAANKVGPPVGAFADNTGEVATTTDNLSTTDDATATTDQTQSSATANGVTTVTRAAGTFLFDGDGAITSPTSYNFSATWAGGDTTATTFDFSDMTQFASEDMFVYTYERNGHEAGSMKTVEFDGDGKITGHFNNGHTQVLYQLALSDFGNPNALEQRSGNVFAETDQSGSASLLAAGTQEVAIRTYAHEISNVDLAQEFTKIIMTQKAYNSAASVFKTVNEMTITARDLKG